MTVQIGFVGLGRMGGNMVHRIRRDSDHEVVAFDFDERAVKQAVRNGARGAGSLKELVKRLRPPRTQSWPPRAITASTRWCWSAC